MKHYNRYLRSLIAEDKVKPSCGAHRGFADCGSHHGPFG